MKKFGLFLLFALAGCGVKTSDPSPLIGSWVAAGRIAFTTETFNADGSFGEKIADAAGTLIQQSNGTWSVSGSSVTMIVTTASPTISGLPITLVRQFSISGDSLTLTTISGIATTYQKVK